VLFSQPAFLFAFLPLVVGVHLVLPRALGNAWLLLASLVFYAWGEGAYVGLLVASLAANHVFGRLVARAQARGRSGRGVVALAAAANLALLFTFKYAAWLLAELAAAPGLAALAEPAAWAERHLALPLGISFYTFQALSFVLDVARRDAAAPRSPLDFGVYLALFPQLVAGPIVRYRDVAEQLRTRTVALAGFAEGVRRFTFGLAKKVLVADVLGGVADDVFALDGAARSPSLAWVGIVCYTLQIYFDFSGYSDMAIGLGRMLGFTFPENFLYPYVSRSVTEFWRRWHISLSTWFRDYLYVPLGGNRRGRARTYTNLVIVFVLCGLWHGAAWTFVVWGLFHGALLIAERAGLRGLLDRAPRVVATAFTLGSVMLGWVVFRADDLPHALEYLGALFGLAGGGPLAHTVALHVDRYELTTMFAGALFAAPLHPTFLAWRARRASGTLGLDLLESSATLALGALAAMALADQTSTPFLYFRF